MNVWGGGNYPYLQTVETSGEDGYEQYASEVILSKEQLIEKLKAKYEDIAINFDIPEELQILEHTQSRKSQNC